MGSGVAGFMLKDAPAEELASAIRRAVRGERIVDPGLAAAALSQGESPLTPREHEVLAEMRLEGLEPPRAYAHTDLNRACLPISPQPRRSADASGCG
jgi:hypothetical protein